MDENKIKEMIDQKLQDVEANVQAGFEELKEDLKEKAEDIKASHDEVVNTKTNKLGAYFFRAVEFLTLCAVVYHIVSSL